MPDTVTTRDARRHLRRLIDEQVADRSDRMYIVDDFQVKQFGSEAAGIFDKSQMNGLERVALSASTFGEIANFIKSQVGRTTSAGEDWRTNGFGQRLHEMIHGRVVKTVEDDADDILSALEGPLHDALTSSTSEEELSKQIARRLRLGYARAYVRHVVAHYTYESRVNM